MEQNNSREDEFSSNVFSVSSYPNNQTDVHVSSGDKGWATLMFSGIFLALVGIALTALAWVNSKPNYLDWTRLVGPIMLITGVICVLISVWKFMVLSSCKPCMSTEEPPVDTEQLSVGQSFVFSGINQPITFHGANVVQYIPPPYSTQDFTGGETPLSPNAYPNNTTWANGASLGPPQYYNIYPMDNPVFVQDDRSPAQLSMIGLCDSLPDASWLPEEFLGSNRTNESPPSYDEIFPTVRRSGTADHNPKLS